MIDKEPDAAAVEDLTDLVQQRLDDEAPEFAGFDFGLGSPVAAISALGRIPVTSCNGGVVGGSSMLVVPSVQCYLRKKHLNIVLRAARDSSVSVLARRPRRAVLS